MNNNLTKDKVSVTISGSEQKLLELLRKTGYGQVVIYLEKGEPVRVEKIKESIKL